MTKGVYGSGVGGYVVQYNKKEYQQAYYEKNRDRIINYGKNYYQRNKEKLKKQQKERYEEQKKLLREAEINDYVMSETDKLIKEKADELREIIEKAEKIIPH